MTGSRFPLYERLGSLLDTFDVQVKAGIFGRPIKETHGTVAQRVAVSHGVEVVANGFRCPPNRANGGTFTDAMGTTCGIVIAVEEAVEALGDMADMASGPLPTQGRSGGKVAAIRERGESVMKAIKDAGGMPFKPDDDFVRKNTEDRFLGRLLTNDQKYAEQRRRVMMALEFAREFLTNGKPPEGWRADGVGYVRNTRVLEALHPEVRELLTTLSTDELIDILTDEAVKFHEGLDRRVRINFPSGHLDSLLSQGRYLTTHETQSKHSGPDMRTTVELNMGFPRELDPTLRPASGYVVHPDWENLGRTERAAATGRDITDHDEVSTKYFGHVAIYGDAQLIMNPAVAERTGYGRGDSLNTHLRPVSMDETDPQLIFNAIMSFDQKESDSDLDTVLSFLEARRTGSYANVNLYTGGDPTGGAGDGSGRDYYEALIPGSVTLEDIEAIRIPYQHLAYPPGRTEARYWDGTDAQERTKAIRDEFFTTEMLQRMGFNEEEIQYILGMLDNFKPHDPRELAIPRPLLTKELKDLLAFREASKNKKAIEEKGIKVIATDSRGLNLFDPSLYRGGSEGMDVEQILYSRIFDSITAQVRKDRKFQEEYAQRRADPDFESMIG